MLLVRTRLDVSAIDGIGLFANQNIPAGTVVWQFDPTIDQRFNAEMLARLSPGAREQIEKYSYREKHSGLYVLCGDDARFFNHSANPNCLDRYVNDNALDDVLDVTIARRDIELGEELTCDYSLFDQDMVDGKYSLPQRSRAISVSSY